jgi:hypothetical protein
MAFALPDIVDIADTVDTAGTVCTVALDGLLSILNRDITLSIFDRLQPLRDEPYFLSIKLDCGYYIFNYHQINTPKKGIGLIARQLIMIINDANLFEVVSRSFDRFPDQMEDFHWSHAEIAKSATKYKAIEKLDGSLIAMFYHNEKVHIATKSTLGFGSMHTDKSWRDIFTEISGIILGSKDTTNVDLALLANYTFIFEIYCAEANHVITRYDKPYVGLLAGRKITGEYLNDEELDHIAKSFPNVTRPTLWMDECTLDELRIRLNKYGEDIDPRFEGVVAMSHDKDGNLIRIKMKPCTYYKLHGKMSQGIGPKLTDPYVVMILHKTSKLDEELFAQKSSDDIRESAQNIINKFNGFLDSLRKIALEYTEMSNKDFAFHVKDIEWKDLLFRAKRTAESSFSDRLNEIINSETIKLIERFADEEKKLAKK